MATTMFQTVYENIIYLTITFKTQACTFRACTVCVYRMSTILQVGTGIVGETRNLYKILHTSL